MPEITSYEMDETFRKTLLTTSGFAEGLRALDCQTWGPAAPLARLCFVGQAGGYYVHAGLRADAGALADRWETVVSAVWVPEAGARRYALDVTMRGPGARDGRLLADLVLTAVITDQADHFEETGDGS
jgi:hypothetical protein